MVRSGLYGRAGLSIGSADRSSHQPLARAIVRSHEGSDVSRKYVSRVGLKLEVALAVGVGGGRAGP